jgi:hypothetical protein
VFPIGGAKIFQALWSFAEGLFYFCGKEGLKDKM